MELISNISEIILKVNTVDISIEKKRFFWLYKNGFLAHLQYKYIEKWNKICHANNNQINPFQINTIEGNKIYLK